MSISFLLLAYLRLQALLSLGLCSSLASVEYYTLFCQIKMSVLGKKYITSIKQSI